MEQYMKDSYLAAKTTHPELAGQQIRKLQRNVYKQLTIEEQGVFESKAVAVRMFSVCVSVCG